MDTCKAPLNININTFSKALRYGNGQCFTYKQAIPAFPPQPQSITALWLVLIPSHGGQKAESTWVAGYIPK